MIFTWNKLHHIIGDEDFSTIFWIKGGGIEFLVFKIIKGPSTKNVRQMGRGVVLKFRTFPDGGRGWFVKVRTSENF